MLIRTHWFGLAAAMVLRVFHAGGGYSPRRRRTVIHPDREGPSAFASNSTVIIAGAASSRSAARLDSRAGGGDADRRQGQVGHSRMIDSHVHFFQSGNLYTRPMSPTSTPGSYAKEVERKQGPPSRDVQVWLARASPSVAI